MVCTMHQRPLLGGQYKAALGKCPELVRVENCMCWNAMVDVLHMLLRVVHPVDVQRHEICVNGSD